MKSLVLLSGGMDSVTVLHQAVRESEVNLALSFDYGSKHNCKEIPFAQEQAALVGVSHQVLYLPFVAEFFSSHLLESGGEIPEGHYQDESMKKTVVPFRNGIMLSIAAGLAESIGAQGIYIAAHTGDHTIYPDCRESFMQSMASAMEEGTYPRIQLLRPFIGLDKGQIVQRGMDLGVDYSRTWSCYKGGELHCGKCGTCVERKEAFAKAGILDPTVYE